MSILAACLSLVEYFTRMLFFSNCWAYLYWIIRPIFKWFLRKTTRLCELQRLCYGEPSGARRTAGVEFSLAHSKSTVIQEVIRNFDDLSRKKLFLKEHQHYINLGVKRVLEEKQINHRIHPGFVVSFGQTLHQIWGYRETIQIIEDLRITVYDSSNADHEEKLLTLWKLLMPTVPLESRVTKQWQQIGFQGDDPKTDFRGMGVLGLLNLVHFATHYPKAASQVLLHAQHPRHGYDFAIVGINITSMAYHLLRDGAAKTQMYNTCKGSMSINHFHHFYSYLFYEFDKYWLRCKPPNMMSFNNLSSQFEKNIRNALADPVTVFKVNIPVDVV